ncbi:MAG TPA: spermidine/putrescine ABC transporter substrate-binding protein [Nocardioides sp.]|uniref:ABC transporter substrate-binding protein n=1 Tax=Nocardioides sp. TaxID=35761 RepID=UPI002F427F84
MASRSPSDATTRRLLSGLGPSSGLSRRSLLRGAGIGALALSSPALLDACGTKGAKVSAGSCVSKDLSSTQKTIVFSNWIGYIDPAKAKDTSTLEKFQQETGIKVDYRNGDVNDNEQFFAKVSPQLQDCKSTGRDVFVLTDWMAARMVDLGWLQKLDHSKMPNVDANLIDSLKSPDWDPHRDYSVPWQSGMTGICYNSDLTDPVTSFKDLLTRPDLKGKIELLTEMRDTMLFMLLLQDSDPGDFTADEFSSAISALQKYVNNGQVRRFTGNDYVDDMKSGDIVACEAWSGDVINLLGGGKYKWVPPDEGFAIWTDNMLVPNMAEHKTNVETMMNFYYDPVNAAKLAAWNYYFCPVKGAQQQIGQFDKSAVHSEFIFPSQKILQNGHAFMSLDQKSEQSYQTQFNEVMGG